MLTYRVSVLFDTVSYLWVLYTKNELTAIDVTCSICSMDIRLNRNVSLWQSLGNRIGQNKIKPRTEDQSIVLFSYHSGWEASIDAISNVKSISKITNWLPPNVPMDQMYHMNEMEHDYVTVGFKKVHTLSQMPNWCWECNVGNDQVCFALSLSPPEEGEQCSLSTLHSMNYLIKNDVTLLTLHS